MISQARAYKNFSGKVQDAQTAINIAISNWRPIYGNKIFKAQPFNAKIKSDSIWVVSGNLKKGWDGGVPHIEIKKDNGEILKITHTR